MVNNLNHLQEGKNNDPKKVPYPFTCQQCGHRCCSRDNLERVFLSPYTAAYINHYKPVFGLDVNGMIERNLLIPIYTDPPHQPLLRISRGAVYCPFLAIDANNFVNLTELMVDTDHEETFFRVFESLYTENQPFVSYPLQSLELLFIEALKVNRDINYSLAEVHQFYFDLLEKYVFHPDKPVQTHCMIYPARPTACRLFPLRKSKKHHLQIQGAIHGNPCPKKAFTGTEQTVYDYFLSQDLFNSSNEYVFFIDQWVHKNKELVASLEAQSDFFSTILFHYLFVKPPYYKDYRLFYKHFDASIIDFLTHLQNSDEITITPITREEAEKQR